MTRQTWTALVSAIAFIACAAGLALIPVPFITWAPGGTTDVLGVNADQQPIVSIQNVKTYPTSGELDLTKVSVTTAQANLSLPEALLAYWLPDRDTLPRESVYSAGKTAEQVQSESAQMMRAAQSEAVVAGLRAAGQPVAERPQVTSVMLGGPSAGKLEPGDFIMALDGVRVSQVGEVVPLVQKHGIGSDVTVTVERDKVIRTVTVTTAPSQDDPNKPALGIEVAVGYSYTASVTFGVDPELGGPSGGLVFALAIYDKLTPGALLGDRHVAGTGTISVDGTVGAIGGVQQKIAGAERDGATVFLVPADNCSDLAGVHTSMRLISVGSLRQAITALDALDDPGQASSVQTC